MTWFAFQGMNSGKAVNLAGSQEKQAVAEGFHGYATEAQAEATPNSVNAVTKYFADAWIADYKAAVDEQAQPGGKNANLSNPVKDLKTGAQGDVKAAADATGLTSVEQFLTGLKDPHLWIRVAKVVAGGIILVVGLVKLTGLEQKAPGIVKTAVKAAPLL